jgi:VIT1/CCC1 family predicted Fe2+/Mn2+ transporter
MGAAVSSFITFSVGACVPLIPYLLGYEKEGIVIAGVLAGIALFGVGSALSLFSGKNAIVGGARMLVVGSIAAAATYFIGSLLGANVA